MMHKCKDSYNFGKTKITIQSEEHSLEMEAEEAVLEITEQVENYFGDMEVQGISIQSKEYNLKMLGKVQGMVTEKSEKPKDEELRKFFQKINILK